MKASRLIKIMLLSGVLVLMGPQPRTVTAQSADRRISRLDRVVANVRSMEQVAGFNRSNLFGAAQNLVAMADRWDELRPQLELFTGRLNDAASLTNDTNATRSLSNKIISNVTLNVSRYSGFTQNETATAWCGSSVVVAFVDTGSEIKTLAADTGVSAVGISTSLDRGSKFAYLGAPSTAGDFSQMLAGDPSIACADADTFYYSASWSDVSNDISGVALAKSTNGGQSFGVPNVIVSKSASSHLVGMDWLAIDPRAPLNLYLVYIDTDFSGTICGTDAESGSPVPRYAVEMVSSADGGTTWSGSPLVIEQVCADSVSPFATLEGPRVAVGPQSQVYVVYEASGENGGSLTTRQIKLAVSTDMGASFSTPAVVTAVNPVGNGADLQGFIRANEFPTLAIGKGKKDPGFLYLAWNDAGDVVPDFFSTTGVYGFADIKFMVSKDGGNTWSAPVRVNNNVEGNGVAVSDQFEPAIGSDKNGKIGICFYDRRRDPNNFLIDRECASSTNGGASWKNQKITATNYPASVGQDILVASDYMGDYDTVVSDATNQSAGLLDSYGTNAPGNPNVATNKF